MKVTEMLKEKWKKEICEDFTFQLIKRYKIFLKDVIHFVSPISSKHKYLIQLNNFKMTYRKIFVWSILKLMPRLISSYFLEIFTSYRL